MYTYVYIYGGAAGGTPITEQQVNFLKPTKRQENLRLPQKERKMFQIYCNYCFKFTVIIESNKDDGREEKEEGEKQDCQEDEGDQLHIHRQCTYIYKYANIFESMHVCMYVCMYVFLYVCIYFCLCVCMYVYPDRPAHYVYLQVLTNS